MKKYRYYIFDEYALCRPHPKIIWNKLPKYFLKAEDNSQGFFFAFVCRREGRGVTSLCGLGHAMVFWDPGSSWSYVDLGSHSGYILGSVM